MNALTFTNRELALADKAKPEKPGEALIRVIMSGICNTDIEIVKGYAGFEGTIGHEFVGIVEESREAPEWTGKRVVGEINVGCGECSWCKKHDARHCPNRTVLGIQGRDGCHAEFVSLPAKNLIEVPEKISIEEATFTEPLAAAFGIMEQVEIDQDTRVAVIGDGKLGILCAWSLSLKSKNVTLIGKYASKLKLAENGRIATAKLESAKGWINQFDVIVEASGAESGFETALDLVRPRGKIVLKSTFQGKPNWEAWRVVVDEISIIGSRCGRFADALKILERKEIDVAPLISESFRLENALEAMEKAQKNGVMKVLIDQT